jgi:phage-related protein
MDKSEFSSYNLRSSVADGKGKNFFMTDPEGEVQVIHSLNKDHKQTPRYRYPINFS